MKTIASLACIAALLLAVSSPAAFGAGQPPELLSYQSYLVDANGVPLGSDLPANYDVVFSIYDSSSGGNLLWSEQQTITVDNGYFSVLLGEGSAVGSDPRPNLSQVFSGLSAAERFVGISVRFTPGGELTDILPRLRLLSSPYSFLSSSANRLINSEGAPILTTETGGVTITGTLNATQISGSGSAISGLNAANITTGTLPLARIPDLPAIRVTSGVFNQARIPTSLEGNRTFTGNVGIGTAPAARLHVSGGNIRLDGNRVLEFGGGTDKHINSGKIGYAAFTPDTLDIFGAGTDVNNRKIKLFTTGGLTIEGPTGIGTSVMGGDANSMLAIRKASADRHSNTIGYGIAVNRINSDTGALLLGSDTSHRGIIATNGSPLRIGRIDNATFRDHIWVDDAGRVGIGTSSPTVPLEISGGISRSTGGSYGFLNAQGGVGSAGSQSAHFSIWASARIAALEFNAISDGRVKEIVGRSDGSHDLETIRRLHVTDYYHVDKVADGSQLRRGFIAQEVRDVIPEAVSESERFVPDIYALPQNVDYQSATGNLKIVMDVPHGVEAGDIVRIFGADSSMDLPVVRVTSPTEFVLGDCEDDPGQVFVYGKRVSDFLTLHYDRIFTTGISAIQELVREVDALRTQTEQLEAELSRIRSVEHELATLKAAVETLAGEIYATGGGE